MKLYISFLNAMQDRQRGAAMPEYGLLVALIAVIAIAAVTLLGQNVNVAFEKIAAAVN